MIEKHQTEPIYSIQLKQSSYVVGVAAGRFPYLLHWGASIPAVTREDGPGRPPLRAFEVADFPEGDASSSSLPVEYALFGGADYRAPSVLVRDREGAPRSTLELLESTVQSGPPELSALPGVDAAEEHLSFLFRVAETGLRLVLTYAALPEIDVVLRHVRLENRSDDPAAAYSVERLMSVTVPVEAGRGGAGRAPGGAAHQAAAAGAGAPAAGSGWELLTLDGAHARERYPHRTALRPGTTAIGSRRGSSSHRHTPWAALVPPDTSEHRGEAYGVGLLYSGDFLIEAEVDEEGACRMNAGLHPDTTRFTLAPGEAVDAPQCALGFSRDGLNGLSHCFHGLVADYLTPAAWRGRPRPVLLNSWEAAYFDVTEADILEIGRTGAQLGVELLVLDDGWFGERNDDTTSLGDWQVNRKKLPGGLERLAGGIHELRLQFGLWVEPEMVSRDSELYRAHPDWCLHVAGEPRLESRNQLVLDLSRAEVRDWMADWLTELIDRVGIDYIKWDMNRYLSNVGSAVAPAGRQAEVPYRYMEGLYAVLGLVTERFPEVLFEGCSGGGGRFDLGMMPYFPQYWTSDNTDAVSRLPIQYGSSYLFPQAAVGAHVTSVPNHQVGRSAPLGFRSMVAMAGNWGFELDPRELSEREAAIIRAEIGWYREHRALLQFGSFYRLENPLVSYSRESSWLVVSRDRSEAVAFWFRPFAEANRRGVRWRLAGLDPDRYYRGSYMRTEEVSSGSREEHDLGGPLSGAELMHRGLPLPPMEQDYAGIRLHLRADAHL